MQYKSYRSLTKKQAKHEQIHTTPIPIPQRRRDTFMFCALLLSPLLSPSSSVVVVVRSVVRLLHFTRSHIGFLASLFSRRSWTSIIHQTRIPNSHIIHSVRRPDVSSSSALRPTRPPHSSCVESIFHTIRSGVVL